MKKTRFSEEQIIGILKEAEAGIKTAELVRKHGISGAHVLPVEGEVRRDGRVAMRGGFGSSRMRIAG